MSVIGRTYKNIVTGNVYKCIDSAGDILTFEGVGKYMVTFEIPRWLVLSKYVEIKDREARI